MNRQLLRLGLALIVLGALAAPRVLAQDTDSTAERATINIIRPEIYLTPVGEDEHRIGMPTTLDAGESLRTGETGVALITWLPDGTEFILGPGTMITLEQFAGSRDSHMDITLRQDSGQLRMGIGEMGAGNSENVWHIAAPAFDARLFQGRFELRVSESGESTLIVTEGSAEIEQPDSVALPVGAHEFVTAQPGEALAEAERLSLDGVEIALSDVCTGEARANVNVRIAPSESSRRLGGLIEGQRFWVRAATEGRLWLQIYYRTGEDDREAHDYGWVYGPIATLDEDHCNTLTAAPLDARIFGGPGVGGPIADEPASDEIDETGETELPATSESAEE